MTSSGYISVGPFGHIKKRDGILARYQVAPKDTEFFIIYFIRDLIFPTWCDMLQFLKQGYMK